MVMVAVQGAPYRTDLNVVRVLAHRPTCPKGFRASLAPLCVTLHF